MDKSTRRDLGYHIARKNRSVHTYSRDYQTAPLHRLAVVLKAVDEKEFDPDCTRSGRFKRKQPEEDAESEKPDEGPDGEWIIAKLYAKLHKRRQGSDKSCCGRATVGLPAFEVHTSIPREANRVRSVFGKCFPDVTLEHLMVKT